MWSRRAITGEQARELLDSIDRSTLVGLRDRALISVMTFALARIGAVVGMRIEDYYPKGKRWWVRLHERRLASTTAARLPSSAPPSGAPTRSPPAMRSRSTR
jgi:site-specific recombinase XerC